jgi:hypothetical protein
VPGSGSCRREGSSTKTIHVKGWTGADVRVMLGNSERTEMEGATMYWAWELGPSCRWLRRDEALSRGSSSEGS